MSEPEIARRCSSCGASIRQQSMFCPQCGTAISQPAAPTTEGVRDRVEKLRKVSSMVIDQAAYDPSLRFLLVAAALFLLFLVLLIISKVIG
jgi:predicted RNA-binding Zn-ribbon protein involved in translation (DUF1610 family)